MVNQLPQLSFKTEEKSQALPFFDRRIKSKIESYYSQNINFQLKIFDFAYYFQPNYPGPSSTEDVGGVEVSNYSPDATLAEKNNDAMIRDFNPSFQKEVEEQVLKSLKDKSSSGNNRNKLINWRILNNGEQTIIVL